MISGIQCFSHRSAPVRPPVLPPSTLVPAQVASWPSSHRLGVMKPNFGVVASLERSLAKWPANVSGSDTLLKVLGVPTVALPSGTTLASHSAVLSMMEWKYMKGLWRVAY